MPEQQMFISLTPDQSTAISSAMDRLPEHERGVQPQLNQMRRARETLMEHHARVQRLITTAVTVLLLALLAVPADAQTVSGRVESNRFQQEYQQYLYENVWWSIAAPATGEGHYSAVIDLYYNRTRAAVVGALVCDSPSLGGMVTIGQVLAREHFMRIENDLWVGADCRLGLFFGSADGAIISYRLRVAGMGGQRPGKTDNPWQQPSNEASASAFYSPTPYYDIEIEIHRLLAAALGGR